MLASILLHGLGCNRLRAAGSAPGRVRQVGFYLGLAFTWAVTQTYADYLAQHMFWVHRLQHLVLHHLAALLIVLSRPASVLRAGLPRALRWSTGVKRPVLHRVYRAFQNPLVAPLLFVGLIVFWLQPEIHFTAMLSARRYAWMNWSMLIDGVLFWAWVFPDRPAGRGYFTSRLLVLWIVMIAQIIIGASIALSHRDLYDVYAVCGRAWALSASADQNLGGLITWIPSAMMSVIAMLLIIRSAVHRRGAARKSPLATRA